MLRFALSRLVAVAVPASLAVVSLLAGACGSSDSGGSGEGGSDRIRVVASFHPLAELARRVGGDAVTVTDLTPPGTEPHDLELSPRQLDQLADADVVLHAGPAFQPAVARAVDRVDGDVVDVLAAVDPQGDGEDGDKADPHFWLDPRRMGAAAEVVAEAIGADSGLSALQRELGTLDAEIEAGLARCRSRILVTAHDAFGAFAARYGLEAQPITGLAPEAEPDPKHLDRLATLVRDRGVETVFTEELVSPKVAEALAREAGVGTAVLDTLEGPGAKGSTYESRMRANLAALRTGLGCG